MKKTILTAALVLGAGSLQATDLGNMIDTIAADLNIKRVHTDRQVIKYHRSHQVARHVTRQKTKTSRHHIANKREKAMAHRKVHKLNFHSISEYKRVLSRSHSYHKKHISPKRFAKNTYTEGKKLGRYVGGGWYSDDDGYYNEPWEDIDYGWKRPRRHKQHGYRYYRRQWYLTYLYERAAFYDSYGFFYGYFDRYGFMFDGRFYRYDYNYTYQDRLHGKGLFEHKYYRPYRSHHIASNDWIWDDDISLGGTQGWFDFRVSFK